MKYIFGCKKSTIFIESNFNSIVKFPPTYSYMSVMPPITNQGNTSKCVAYSVASWLDWRKNIGEKDNNGGQFNVDTIYNVRKDKNANGMMITEALHFLKTNPNKLWHIKGYARLGGTEYIKSSLITNGPAIAGMMVRSNNSDFWNGYETLGGHCVLIIGYNEKGFIIRNSWGNIFGNKGYTIIPYSQLTSNNMFECWTILS